jgi:hypothetical protein
VLSESILHDAGAIFNKKLVSDNKLRELIGAISTKYRISAELPGERQLVKFLM